MIVGKTVISNQFQFQTRTWPPIDSYSSVSFFKCRIVNDATLRSFKSQTCHLRMDKMYTLSNMHMHAYVFLVISEGFLGCNIIIFSEGTFERCKGLIFILFKR